MKTAVELDDIVVKVMQEFIRRAPDIMRGAIEQPEIASGIRVPKSRVREWAEGTSQDSQVLTPAASQFSEPP
jgi:predicted XRE-type DNA-binding protein